MPSDLIPLPLEAELSHGAKMMPAMRTFLERSLERSEANVERLTERLATEGRERVNPGQIRNNQQNADNVKTVLNRYDDQGRLLTQNEKPWGWRIVASRSTVDSWLGGNWMSLDNWSSAVCPICWPVPGHLKSTLINRVGLNWPNGSPGRRTR